MTKGRIRPGLLNAAAAVLVALSGCAGSPQRAMVRGEVLPDAPAPEASLKMAEVGGERDLARPEAAAPKAEAAGPAPAEAAAARTVATLPVFRPRPPEMLARIEGPDLQALPIVVHDVTVVVSAHRARIVFDMVFANPSGRVLAGTLMIGLPDRASPCYLATFDGRGPEGGGAQRALLAPEPPGPEALLAQPVAAQSRWAGVDWGAERVARVVEPGKGREVYEAVTRRRVDPALAEWAGTGTYSARIYPLPPGAYKRVLFAYDQTLPPSGGRIVLPLPEPAAAAALRRITVHELGGQLARPTLTDGRQPVASEQTGAGRVWRPALAAGKQAELLFEAALRAPGVSVLAGADAAVPGTLATVLFTPELPPRALVTPTGRALFVLDTSSSGREGLYALSGQMLRRVLESDDSIGEFAVLAFDVRAALLTPGFVRNTAEARAGALADVERLRLEGATSFASVIDALEGQPDLMRAETFFLLSDGEITWGADDPAQIAAAPRVAAKRWVCYAFGTTPHNERLFEELSRSGGQIVRVGPGQDLADAARAHRLPVSRLEWVRSIAQDELVVAGSPALLYPGQVLEIALRTSRPTAEVRLVARIDGRDTEIRVPLGRSVLTDALAARAWAETWVSDLLGESDEASQRVVFALSRAFSLANEHASFLILENDQEYKQYGVADRPLDFREIRQTLAGRRVPAREQRLVLAGLELPDDLGDDTAQLLRSLASLPPTPVWEVPPAPEIASGARVLLQQPRVTRGTDKAADTPTAIYKAAADLRSGGGEGKPDRPLETAQALRVLSAVAEVAPRDDRALRLVGFTLLDWGLYDEAERLFGRVRARRPFEPQNLLLEALAEAAQGKLAAAALRHEMVLTRPFPRFAEEARAVSMRLYADLLAAALRAHPGHPLRAAWQRRLDALREAEPALAAQPAGRLVLFWNIDDTDVDLHIQEGRWTEVWYENMESRSGGRLFWDNTEGLGPELYEHPKLRARGFEVFVDYFGSSSVEGEAPAATFVAAFTLSRDGATTRASFHATVLAGVEEDRVRIMPLWKRGR